MFRCSPAEAVVKREKNNVTWFVALTKIPTSSVFLKGHICISELLSEPKRMTLFLGPLGSLVFSDVTILTALQLPLQTQHHKDCNIITNQFLKRTCKTFGFVWTVEIKTFSKKFVNIFIWMGDLEKRKMCEFRRKGWFVKKSFWKVGILVLTRHKISLIPRGHY